MKKIAITFLITILLGVAAYGLEYSIELKDDGWGDGWNGGSVDVIVNGSVVLDDKTLETGYSTTYTFNVSSGDMVIIDYKSGMWATETAYYVYDQNDDPVVWSGEDGTEPSDTQFTVVASPHGSGTEADPYLITNLDELHWITQDSSRWGAHYKQDSNIDASATSTWNSGAGFLPIGNSTTKFTGSYDGQIYEIDNLYIDRGSENYVGLFGYTNGATIENVWLDSAVVSGDNSVGGLVGYNWESTVSKSFATGSVSGASNVGGLVGYNDGGGVENSYWDTETSGQTTSDGGTGKSTAEMKDISTFQSTWTITAVEASQNDYPYLAWEEGETGVWRQEQVGPDGSGTEADPYLISNLDELEWITQDSGRWNAHYEQTADIDASATSTWNSGAGFLPIGNSGTNFTGSYDGTYDGNEYVISNLHIDRPTTMYVGLFGYTGSIAEIKNVGLVDATVTGSDYVGGIVGWNGGIVNNSYATGSVDGSYQYIGGLVGGNTGTVESSYSTGNASGYSDIGGLVGGNGGTVENSYATGDASGSNNFAGGLVGSNSGIVNNSYATGSVGGSLQYIGGLVGYNNDDGTVNNSYSTGSVDGSGDNVGGLVGDNSGTVTNSYWDTETSGQTTSDGGTGKTTAEMKDISTFQSAWTIDRLEADQNDYPYLAWQDGEIGVWLQEQVTVQPPTASFVFTPPAPKMGQQVFFDASGSSDVDGPITTYEWDWDNDGNYEGSGQITNHTFNSAGTYTVGLRVTDDDNATDTTRATITVGAGPAVSLSVSAAPQTLVADGASTSSITATVKNSYGMLLSGINLTFTTEHGTLSSSTATTAGNGKATVTLTAPIQPNASTVKTDTPSGVSGATTVFFQEPGGPDVASSQSLVIEGGQAEGTIDASGDVGVSVTVRKKSESTTQEVSVTVAKFTDNPEDQKALDVGSGGYLDVHVDNTDALEQVVLRVYLDPWPSEPRVRFWDGSIWVNCTHVTFHEDEGYAEVTIRTDTQPNLADLAGLPVAGGGLDVEYIQVRHAGWSMVQSPLEPENKDPVHIFEGVPPQTIFHYDPGANDGQGQYLQAGQLGGFTVMNANQGSWISMSDTLAPKVFSVAGVYSGNVTIELTDPGWHQVGPPMDYGWRNIGVKQGEDGDTMTVAQQAAGPSAPHWMSRFIWEFDTEANGYNAYDANNTGFVLQKSMAYWVKTYEPNVKLVIPYNAPPPVPSSTTAEVRGIPMNSARAAKLDIPNPPAPPAAPSTNQGLNVTAAPNPVQKDGTVTFDVQGLNVDQVKLSVYDSSGRVTYSSDFRHGTHLTWDLTSEDGGPVANGLYLYMVEAKTEAGLTSSTVERLLVLQ